MAKKSDSDSSLDFNAPTTSQIAKVATGSIIGSIIEQYDFLVTGIIAATVWGTVFFHTSLLAGIAAALSIYGLGIIIRPVGAYIFGHIADRRGRRDSLVYALVLMGVATLLIGLTPGYATLGIAAAVLLLIFRLLQGISFGAEFGTASTWVVEYAAKSKHRAFWGAWTGFAIPFGLLLGFGSVLAITGSMSHAAFMSYGWRILFGIGFIVAVIGVIIRMRLSDSLLFDKFKQKRKVLEYPASRVWKEMPGRILGTSLVNAMFGGAFFLAFVFGTSYMTAVGFSAITAEEIGLIAAAGMFVFMLIASVLADKYGRKPILMVAAIVLFVFAIPYFALINTGNFWLATLADLIGFGFVFGFGYGAIPVFYTENFPTKYRASGASAGYQISQVYGGGLVPILAGMILAAVGIHIAYLYIGIMIMIYTIAAMAAILYFKDTTKLDLVKYSG
ncbi:MAG: MFS transporter [Candidatus Micrarchaeales archaeon]|jgi:Arabinose efflux permease|uniref:General substrate transporter n=1 Tax=Candidatus Micrarchaeum acidiphilum ARMAN-2 TaxID=425595 RepID=C7DHU2_MICA2|nr:MAG: General substrate transporter [Candidatus Micrarchaeum acidiphilum ARMAN-2]MCW6160764.1 MFS transporter [Candidatus Micrarchaeales archaeon]